MTSYTAERLLARAAVIEKQIEAWKGNPDYADTLRMEAYALRLAAHPAPDGGYAVKPLEWESSGSGFWESGHYQTWHQWASDGLFHASVRLGSKAARRIGAGFKSLEAAQAAAQADYEHRIRSALIPQKSDAGYVALLSECRQFIADAGCDEDDNEVNARRDELLAAIAALPAPAKEVTVEEFGLAMRLTLPNTLPEDFYVRGSKAREAIFNEMSRHLRIEFTITPKGTQS